MLPLSTEAGAHCNVHCIVFWEKISSPHALSFRPKSFLASNRSEFQLLSSTALLSGRISLYESQSTHVFPLLALCMPFLLWLERNAHSTSRRAHSEYSWCCIGIINKARRAGERVPGVRLLWSTGVRHLVQWRARSRGSLQWSRRPRNPNRCRGSCAWFVLPLPQYSSFFDL
jgi:hypothetical protein